ncbi:MAG: hypothetical protein K6G23_10565 [Lachnospiraceae bacterium]|nr:hypothetical protein [Lachnospiraceae bacterium]
MKNRGNINTQFDTVISTCIMIAMINMIVICALGGLQTAGYLGLSVLIISCMLGVLAAPLVMDLFTKIRFCYQRELHFRARRLLSTAKTMVILICALLLLSVVVFGKALAEGVFANVNMQYFLIISMVILFLGCVESIFLGMLKGLHMIKPIRLTMLLQQLLIFAGSILLEQLCSRYAVGIAGILRTQDVIPAYRALGALCGVLAGEVIGCLLLLVFYHSVHREFPGKDRQIIRRRQPEERFLTILGSFFQSQLFTILQNLFLMFAFLLDYLIWVRLSAAGGTISNQLYFAGILFGLGLPLAVFFLQWLKLLHFSTEPHQRAALRDKDLHFFREMTMANLFHLILVALPITCLLVVLAQNLPEALTGESISEKLILVLRLSAVLFMACALFVMTKLQLRLVVGKIRSTLLIVLAFILQTIVALISIGASDQGEVMVCMALLVFMTINGILHLIYCRQKCHLPYPDYRAYALCAAAMLCIGFIVYLLSQFMFAGIAALIGVIVTIVLFGLLYFIAMLFLPISEGNVPSSVVLEAFEQLRERMRL